MHHRLPVRAHVFSCWYASPQVPEDARRLFDSACENAGLCAGPLPDPLEPRATAIALALSREWGIADLEARLRDAIEEHFEPTWDRTRGEFTWGLGLGEPHPRGQYNAFLAAAEANSRGSWTRLSEGPLEDCPQVVGVDFPNVALAEARWVGDELRLRLDVLRPDANASTSFRIINADVARKWDVAGGSGSTLQLAGNALVVTTPLISGDLRVEPRRAG